MATHPSTWRRRAAEVICTVLDALPAEATRADAEAALRGAAHAFRADGTSWPYQCWLRERRRALDARFPVPRKVEAPPQVVYTLAVEYRNEPDEPLRQMLWLGYRCGWCSGRYDGPCLQCAGHARRVRAVVDSPEFRSLRAAAAADPALVGVLRDWLGEQGIDVTEG